MTRNREWMMPLTGIAFVALFIAVFVLLGEGQDATKKSAEQIVKYYKDHETTQTIGSLLIGIASILLLFFAGYLRRVLRAADPTGSLPDVAFAGAIVFAAGASVAGSIHLALPDLADDVPPEVLQAINAIDYDLFMYFPVGLGTMILASALSTIRHGAFPKWLGWVGVVLAVLFVTPGFFVGLIGCPLWILIASVILMMRARATPPAATPPPAMPA
jgi:uncharacterized protein DUF4386